MRQQAKAFDGGAADNIAPVFGELPENFGGETNLTRCACGAGGNESEMLACAAFRDGYFGEDRCQLGGMRSEIFSIAFGDAAGHVSSADT